MIELILKRQTYFLYCCRPNIYFMHHLTKPDLFSLAILDRKLFKLNVGLLLFCQFCSSTSPSFTYFLWRQCVSMAYHEGDQGRLKSTPSIAYSDIFFESCVCAKDAACLVSRTAIAVISTQMLPFFSSLPPPLKNL